MAFTITSEDITDMNWVREATKQTTFVPIWISNGLKRFQQLCVTNKVDYSQIPDTDVPYIPTRLLTLTTICAFLRDSIGSDWREIREGFSIDVYQAKLNQFEKEIQELLGVFTPESAGYDSDTTDQSNPMSFSFFRG